MRPTFKLAWLLVCWFNYWLIADMAQADWAATLEQARQAYNQGNYTQAQELYLSLLKAGLNQAALYYNLGNAEFKAGHIGRAIGYYRRARQMDPWDEDIQYNLNFARQQVKQPLDKAGPVTRFLQEWLNRFTASSLLLAAWISYVLFACGLGAMILLRQPSYVGRWLASVLGVVFLFLALWASWRMIVERQVRWGVIVTSQAEARNGPREDFPVGFTVPEGREVRILGQEGSWIAIGLPAEGYKGWVQTNDVWPDN